MSTAWRQPVPLHQAYRLINHGPTVLVSSAHEGRRNIMAAAWNSALDFSPPKVLVVIDRATYTRELVEASGRFAINVPTRALAQATRDVGSVSGRGPGEDKFDRFGLETFAGDVVEAPLLTGCAAWLECRVMDEPHNQQAYDLFIGEVVAASADARVFSDGRWHFDGDDSLRTIHYVAGGTFHITGDGFEVGA